MKKFRAHIKNMYKPNPIVTAFVATHTHTPTHTERHTDKLTINNNGGCSASSFGHYILGHTRVVGCVRETRLLDDQVVVNSDIEVSVLRRVDYLFIF